MKLFLLGVNHGGVLRRPSTWYNSNNAQITILDQPLSSICLVWKQCQCQFFNNRLHLRLNRGWMDVPFICYFGQKKIVRNVGSCVCEVMKLQQRLKVIEVRGMKLRFNWIKWVERHRSECELIPFMSSNQNFPSQNQFLVNV